MKKPASEKSRSFRRQHKLAPYLFISPFLITFLIFGCYPILQSVRLSLYATNGPKSHVFVGLSNYQFLIGDTDFRTAVWNTLVYAFWSVFLQLPLALGLAMLLSQKWIKARGLLRMAFFSPNLMGQAFVAVLFGILYVPQYGLVNRALHPLLPKLVPLDTKWLQDAHLVMPAIVLASLWMYVLIFRPFWINRSELAEQGAYCKWSPVFPSRVGCASAGKRAE